MPSLQWRCTRATSMAAVLAMLVPVVLAHHSFAMFDMTRTVDIVGAVTEFRWTNPHIRIDVDVTVPGSLDAQHWVIEGSALPVLEHEGWTRDTLHPGDKLTVMLHPRLDGALGGSLVGVVLADGRYLGGGARKP